MVHVSLDAENITAFVDLLPRQLFQARRSAIAKTTTLTKQSLQQRMASQLHIPSKVWRRYRMAVRRKPEQGLVWVGLNEVKAAYTGAMRQGPHGAYAGERYFPGAFIATMRSGHKGIFSRTGAREKRNGKWFAAIAEEMVDVDLGFHVTEAVAQQATETLRTQFIDRVLALNSQLRAP